ncbi:MAG: hypothetical protein HOI24_02070 [Candidatus Magasanikbacteria bacterium]|nr:hypothetical protein [Candidatus Magasanikbacteria bacterium]
MFADIEECDDENSEDGDGCSSFCISEIIPSCGNDILEADEVCDDGNRFDGDGCSALCTIESKKLALGNFILRLANGAIRPQVDDEKIYTLTGDTVQISLDKEFFDEYSVQSMVLQYVVGVDTKKFVDRGMLSFIDPVYAVEEGLLQKQLGFVPQTQRFSSSLVLGEAGIQDVDIVIRYKDGEVDRVPLQINITQPGTIISDDSKEPLVGSTVTLIDDQSNDVWQSVHFDQNNPTPVSKDGTYGFIVPNGEYILRVEKEGYRTQESFSFRVENNIVNEDVVLMKKLPKLIDSVEDILEEDISAGEKVQKIAVVSATKAVEVAKVGVRTVVEVAKKIDDVADDPLVEEVTEEVIIPTTVAASATIVLPSLWSIIIPLLRFLFLQPLLLLGLRKRKEWGVIYNALTKLPIDLAVVRIVNAETKKVVQSRVTDLKGRFLFIVNPGSYVIEVTKPGFSYPSSILQSVKSDGRFADIYHSETIEVTQKGVGLTPNIPVDPVDAEKTPKRIVWEKRLRIVQHIFASSGIYTTMVGLYIAPTLWLCGFLAVHIVVYLLFIHLIQPKQPKGWGIVYDSESGEPLAKAVVRLFNKQYDKLVATFVTDRKGRYAFLVGPSVYYHISEKSGYRELIGPDIRIKEKKAEGGIIKTDVHLEKDGET